MHTLSEYYSTIELTNTDYIVIIPNQGCGGCITVAEQFYNEHKMAKNVKFIFTNIISQKMLNQKVQIFSNNTFLDTNNIMLKSYPKNKNLYPCILKLKNGAIIEISYQSPEENGFNNLIIK
jgi:thiol-disulfide isomerase/thioredoxin